MSDYEEVTGEVEVPRNVGVRGFLKAIEDILKLPRVQDIHIDARGKVTYRHFMREGEERKPLSVDFESLMPYAVIRNSRVVELLDPDLNACVAVGQLFSMALTDHLYPVAVVGGANTNFWKWLEASTGLIVPSEDELFGVPFMRDRQLEDYVLVLCAGYARGAALVDTQKSYKLVIPQVKA